MDMAAHGLYQNRKHDPRPGTRSCGASTNACPSPPSAIGLQGSAGAARVLSGTSRGDRAGLAGGRRGGQDRPIDRPIDGRISINALFL